MGGWRRSLWAWAALVLLAPAVGACAPSQGSGPVPMRSQPAPADAGVTAASAEDASADSSAWRGRPVARVEDLLEFRFPGVQVIRLANGDVAVRIRGGTSISGNNEPLYVIDGMEITPGPGGALAGINPGDVVRIEVLKDVGSTALYGVRGANGVILITTRRGK